MYNSLNGTNNYGSSFALVPVVQVLFQPRVLLDPGSFWLFFVGGSVWPVLMSHLGLYFFFNTFSVLDHINKILKSISFASGFQWFTSVFLCFTRMVQQHTCIENFVCTCMIPGQVRQEYVYMGVLQPYLSVLVKTRFLKFSQEWKCRENCLLDLDRIANSAVLINQFLQNQSDLGLFCLPRPVFVISSFKDSIHVYLPKFTSIQELTEWCVLGGVLVRCQHIGVLDKYNKCWSLLCMATVQTILEKWDVTSKMNCITYF